MKLDKKKHLAAKTLKVGKGRIILDVDRLDEIKEAITKQDMKNLFKTGAIRIKEVKGRRSKVRKKRKRDGKIKKKVQRRKQEYVKITRKLRTYVKEIKKQGKISREEYWELRKQIKARVFKSKAQLKEFLRKHYGRIGK